MSSHHHGELPIEQFKAEENVVRDTAPMPVHDLRLATGRI